MNTFKEKQNPNNVLLPLVMMFLSLYQESNRYQPIGLVFHHLTESNHQQTLNLFSANES